MNLNSEAELAGVLGHEIGHVTARHPARRQARGVAASLGAMAAAILTGSNAIGQLANIGGAGLDDGIRPRERDGSRSARHEVHGEGRIQPRIHRQRVQRCSRPARSSNAQRAAAEGREPRLYHGVFSSHPSPDERAVQAAKGAANIKDAPPDGWIERHDEYLTTINGIAYGSSKAQGIVRDNRFYHADMGITVAFPRGWTIENQRDRLHRVHAEEGRDDADHDRREAREAGAARISAQQAARAQSVFKGEPITTAEGNEGYTIVTRSGSPIDNGLGPVRWAVDLSRPERLHLRRREPLGDERRAGSRRPHQVDGADAARPASRRNFRSPSRIASRW